MNKKIFSIIILMIIILSSFFLIPKKDIKDRSYINDELKIIKIDTINYVTNINQKLNNKIKNAEVQVHTINLAGQSSTSQVSRLFKEAVAKGLDVNSSVLIMIGKDEITKKVYVEMKVGHELEKTLPAKRMSEIINSEMIPFIKNNDFDTAIKNGVDKLNKIIKKEYGNYYEEDFQYKNKSIAGLFKFLIIVAVTAGLISAVFLGLHFITGNNFYKDTLLEVWTTIIEIVNKIKKNK